MTTTQPPHPLCSFIHALFLCFLPPLPLPFPSFEPLCALTFSLFSLSVRILSCAAVGATLKSVEGEFTELAHSRVCLVASALLSSPLLSAALGWMLRSSDFVDMDAIALVSSNDSPMKAEAVTVRLVASSSSSLPIDSTILSSHAAAKKAHKRAQHQHYAEFNNLFIDK